MKNYFKKVRKGLALILALGLFVAQPLTFSGEIINPSPFGFNISYSFTCRNFYDVVRQASGIGPHTNLQFIHVQNIRHLDASWRGITSLDGIWYLPNLITLDVSNNLLTSVDLSLRTGMGFPITIHPPRVNNILETLDIRNNFLPNPASIIGWQEVSAIHETKSVNLQFWPQRNDNRVRIDSLVLNESTFGAVSARAYYDFHGNGFLYFFLPGGTVVPPNMVLSGLVTELHDHIGQTFCCDLNFHVHGNWWPIRVGVDWAGFHNGDLVQIAGSNTVTYTIRVVCAWTQPLL